MFFGILITLFLVYFVSNAVDNKQSEKPREIPIQTKLEAIEKAESYAGFVEKVIKDNDLIKLAKAVKFEDSTTPFLGHYSSNSPVWKISAKNSYILSKSVADYKEANLRDFDIYIDSISGKLLKIECQYGTKDLALCPILDKKSAEKQISDGGHKYLSIPDDRPKIDFYAALLACPYDPLSAKEILGQYVYFSYGNRPPRPVWIITLVGISPIKLFGPDSDWVPEYQLNRVRQIIDAETGKVILTSTVPGVPLKPEDKARLFPNLDK
ncbi:MAG: hypothetical protein GY865_02390 [candidate division Zixibacteria bacterium]|nr:hypothetical protein [candidate division Zixibacteria bacterium]